MLVLLDFQIRQFSNPTHAQWSSLNVFLNLNLNSLLVTRQMTLFHLPHPIDLTSPINIVNKLLLRESISDLTQNSLLVKSQFTIPHQGDGA